jgi:hypothetical protein
VGWDAVPWFVGNGATHSDAVVRMVAFAAFNGNEGVLGPSDLKVTALATPGASVNVATGACTALARGAAQTYQAYAGRMATQDTVSIAATGAGAGRSDLVIARVEDPNVSGSPWSQPSNIAAGPYIFTRVISGVPSTTKSVLDLNLGYTAVTLARIDIPASTAAITQAMIVDLRKVANPRRQRSIYTVNPSAVASITAASYANWIGSWSVDVPTWAVRAVITVNASGIGLDRTSTTVSGTATGGIRAALGSVVTQGAAFDEEATPATARLRFGIAAGDTPAIPSSMRGTTQTLTVQAQRSAGSKNAYADTVTFAAVDIEFQEAAG